MIISKLSQKEFPMGNNLHFACSVSSGKFLLTHASLDWAFPDETNKDVKDVIDIIAPEEQLYLQQVVSQLLSGNFSGNITVKLLGPKGNVWLRITPFLAEYQDEKVISGTVVDVSPEVLNNQSVAKFADKKNSILHMLGHDLRGPLNIARSLTKTITRELEDPVLLEKTGHIETILQQSIDMISDLIKREFLEIVDAELVKNQVNIVKLLKDYLEECKRSENISGISFQLNSSDDKILIRLDHAKFMQVVNNLISNSLKFTTAGGTISVTIKDSAEQVNLIFSDTGIGIPEALLPEIFEKYTAARRPGLHGEPTIGLGLSIVKTIIRWHNGRISCESSEASGTRFFITLPKNLQG
jgi:two-component system sensor histidine kinase VicK